MLQYLRLSQVSLLTLHQVCLKCYFFVAPLTGEFCWSSWHNQSVWLFTIAVNQNQWKTQSFFPLLIRYKGHSVLGTKRLVGVGRNKLKVSVVFLRVSQLCGSVVHLTNFPCSTVQKSKCLWTIFWQCLHALWMILKFDGYYVSEAVLLFGNNFEIVMEINGFND